jgi:hypothetical protein
MEQVRRRVTDKRVLQLVRRFLAAGIMREQGSLAATPSGTPQGSSIGDPCGVPRSRATSVPSGIRIGAFSHRSMYNRTHRSWVW